MTATLQWISEQFPRHGALAAEGFSKLLGRPSLDSLTVLVRETAQNSWDARLARSSVHFSIDGFTLDDRQWSVLANNVFADLPPDGLPLAGSLEKEGLAVLVISDRHTLGLGGPTRADRPTDGPTDYIDLLMNVGVGGHEFGGGTYGFGKAIAYVVSGARTIIVHSRSSNGLPEAETRLIASGIGDSYIDRQWRYTGRHWWGRDSAGAPEPLRGRPAENLARAIGFPGFEDADTGTSIMVIDPDFGDREPVEAMRFLADAITWHLWPKMVRKKGRQPMRFAVTWEGRLVPVAHPDDVPPLHGYVQALEALREHDQPFRRDDGLEVIEIRARRPNRRLGRLALYTFVAKARLPGRQVAHSEVDEEIEPLNAAAFTGNAHHVALLRAPELVVAYLPGPEMPETALEWGGVFVCDLDLDAAFASSEPPTHDDWQPTLVVEKKDRTVVKIALREIRDTLRSRAAIAQGTGRPGKTSVARVADALAGLVTGVPATAAGRTPRQGTRGGPSRPSRPSIIDATCQPVLVDGIRLTKLDFSLSASTPGPVRLQIRTCVATNDGSGIESEPPAGSPTPMLVHVRGPVTVDVDRAAASAEVTATVTGVSEWTVLATSPDDVMVAFDVQVDAVGSAEKST